MSEQDFRERVLSAIDDLKRTIDRMDDRIDRRLTIIEEDARNLRDALGELRGNVKQTIERVDEKVDGRFTTVGKEVSELRGDIRWIRGKLEERQEGI